MPKKNQYLLFLMLTAAICWIFSGFLLQVWVQPYVFPDSYSYLLAAEQLYQQNVLNEHRPMVMAAICGFPFLFGASKAFIFKWIIAVNFVAWLLSIALIYKMAAQISTAKLGFVTALVYIFCFGSLFLVFHLMSESIFAFLLVAVFFLIHLFVLKSQIKYLCAAIALAILTVMVKPIAFGFLFVIVFFFGNKIPEMVKSRFSVVPYLVLVMLFFQMVTLKRSYGVFTVSTISSATYYNYLGTRADCFREKTTFAEGKNQRVLAFGKLSLIQQKKVASTDLMEQIQNNKINLLKAVAVNFWINGSKGSASVYGCQNIKKTSFFETAKFTMSAISKLQNIILTSIGLILGILALLRPKKNSKFINLVALLILYLFAMSAISSDQGDRFHVVVYPFILLLIVYFLQQKSPAKAGLKN